MKYKIPLNGTHPSCSNSNVMSIPEMWPPYGGRMGVSKRVRESAAAGPGGSGISGSDFLWVEDGAGWDHRPKALNTFS